MTKFSMGLLPSYWASKLGADTLAVRTADDTLTWGQLADRAGQRAAALQSIGVKQNDLVTLALGNSNEFFEWTFAIWRLGATPHLVSPRLPEAEMRTIIDLVQPKALITHSADNIAQFGARPSAWGLGQNLDSDFPDLVADYWRAMSSGGSTGRPKIIVDHRRSMVDLSTTYLRLATGDVVLNPGPLYHSAPFNMSHNALFKGLPLINMERFDPERALALIDKCRVTSVNFVPTMMQRIWRLPGSVRSRYDVSSLTNVWHMAAPMPAWLKEAWIEWIGPEYIFEAYAGTERLGSTVINGVDWLKHKGSVGRSHNCQVTIVDDAGNILPPGEVGEILFKSDTEDRTFHYIGADEKNWDGGFRSLGDYGWLDEDGFLYVSDRRTDMILSGGANIYPAEIESALMEHPGVQVAVVIGLPHEDLGSRVHAIIQPEVGYCGELNDEILLAFLSEKLVKYKMPRSLEFVSYDLRNEAGKVNRSKLRQDRMA